jgi:hypothetical protein
MSEHFGFAEDEWDLVLEVPLDIFLCLVQADVAVESIDQERAALEAWLGRAAIACADSPWMKEAVESADRPSGAQARGAVALPIPELKTKLSRMSEILEHKAPGGESRAFKRLLLSLAEQIAAASGGAMTGGAHVSQRESDLIWEIRQALGLASA